MTELRRDLPTEQLVKTLIDDSALRALLGNDMRAKDVRAAVVYYQRGLNEIERNDLHAAKVCMRALEALTMEWPSFQLFVDDLHRQISELKLEKLQIVARV